MNTKIHKAIRISAEKTRKWIESFIEKQDSDLYTIDCYDTCGWCAVAASKLYRDLQKNKKLHNCVINPTVVGNMSEGNHAFVTVSFGNVSLIVDVTADQFGKNTIEIRNANANNLPWFWSGKNKWGKSSTVIKQGEESFFKEVKKWGAQSPQRYGLM